MLCRLRTAGKLPQVCLESKFLSNKNQVFNLIVKKNLKIAAIKSCNIYCNDNMKVAAIKNLIVLNNLITLLIAEKIQE